MNKTPTGLSALGKKIWKDLSSKYSLFSDEAKEIALAIVDNCECIELARKAVKDRGILIESPKGGVYLNPAEGQRAKAVSENLKLRKALEPYRVSKQSINKTLGLDEDDE